jgi:hypothetical protein
MVVTRPGSRESFTLEIEPIHVRLVMAASDRPVQVQRVWALEPRDLGPCQTWFRMLEKAVPRSSSSTEELVTGMVPWTV